MHYGKVLPLDLNGVKIQLVGPASLLIGYSGPTILRMMMRLAYSNASS